MRLRSELELPDSGWNLRHPDGIVALGSCFAGQMGQRLVDRKFRCLVNPFGILYHPIPLIRPLLAAIQDDPALDTDLFEQEGRWRSLHFHSEISHRDRQFLEQRIAARRSLLRETLERSQTLILTFGTAIGFHHQERQIIVGNCHKLPAATFRRETSSLAELREAMEDLLTALSHFRPGLKVLLTVSPVRHLRSGIVANSTAKAILRTLCHELTEAHPAVAYFPAYELMLDDLRDYRFYREDLMHPTELAERYIWEKFSTAFIAPSAQKLVSKWEEVQRDLAHHPSEVAGDAYQTFLKKVSHKIEALADHLDMGRERKTVEERRKD
ncbi:MAG: GSCFA domain-containing protein [Bacteroidota bacterium]